MEERFHLGSSFFLTVFLLACTRSILHFAFALFIMLFYLLRTLVLLVCGLGRPHPHRGRWWHYRRRLKGVFSLLVPTDPTALLTEAVHLQALCPLPLRGAGGVGAGSLRRFGSGKECGRHWQRSSSSGSWTVGRRQRWRGSSGALPGGKQVTTARWLDSTVQVRYPLPFGHQRIAKTGIQNPFL